MKRTNAYCHPEYRRKVARVHRRSRRICEARIRCAGAPVVGDPHHPYYLPFEGWRRLMIPDDDLIDCCRRCHLHFEAMKAAGTPVPPAGAPFLDAE